MFLTIAWLFCYFMYYCSTETKESKVMNRKYTRPAHYGWVEKVKGLFSKDEIDECFRYTNSYIEIIVKKSECKLTLRLSFVGSDENNLAENGHICCICGPITGIRQSCVLDVLGWDQAISLFQTIKQQVSGSTTFLMAKALFDDLKSVPDIA